MYTREQVIEKSTEYFNGDTLAATVFADKYALKSETGEYVELTPDDMHKRLAKEFARIENKYPNSISEQDIYDSIKEFKYIVPQGSPMAGIGNHEQLMSLSNCFVVDSPYDSYSGILRADQELTQVYVRRGGAGIDVSTIRPKGMVTRNAARTTDGISGFLERYSNTTREVATAGRRAALMLSISVHHPEIETFIKIKKDRKKVTGANISVRLSDEFMNAVKNNEEYEQRWPIDSTSPTISKKVNAKHIWDMIVDSAWESAEPGILFWDNIINNGAADAYEEYKSKSTNPCMSSDTKVLTRYFDIKTGKHEVKAVNISELVDKEVEIFDGINWVINSKFQKTGENIQLYKITLNSGDSIRATNYHTFILNNGDRVQLKDLKIGNKLRTIQSSNIGFEKINNAEIVDIKIDTIEDVYCTTVESTNSFAIITSNHICLVGNCAELPLSPYDSCRLICMNTLNFVKNPYTKSAYFDYELYAKYVKIAQRMMDDIIDLEAEHVDRILNKLNSDPEPEDIKRTDINLWNKIKKSCLNGRRTGLGVTAIGDTLAALGVVYGSDESIKIVEEIYKQLELESYKTSIDLAEERGSFPVYNYDNEKNHVFISKVINELPNEYKEKYIKFGRRNIANTTTAPGGSVSILTKTTSGIEPVFQISYSRRKKINQSENIEPDYIDTIGDKWKVFKVYHPQFLEWSKITGETDETKSPWFGSTAQDINWSSSVDLQASAQKWVCASISKTCNLPSTATKELVSEVYMKAWETGCKGFTVYRDGCRDGVLVSDKESIKNSNDEIIETNSPKRPETLECDIHHMKVKGENWIVLVGKLKGKPFEVFAGLSKFVSIPKKIVSGKIVKKESKKDNGSSIYNLVYGDETDPTIIKDIVSVFENATEGSWTRLVSLSLRHGGPIQHIVQQLNKDEHSDMYSFSRVIGRVLKTYIKDGTKIKSKCPNCGSENMTYQEGCLLCHDCGHSKC